MKLNKTLDKLKKVNGELDEMYRYPGFGTYKLRKGWNINKEGELEYDSSET